jgi:hypothetical protein
MTTLQNHTRLLALLGVWIVSAFPLLSAENPKQLMADASYNELQQRKQNPLLQSQVERRTAGHVYREQEIETADGPVRRLISIDGHEPSPSERKKDNDRLRELMEDPKARVTLKQNREAQEKKVDDLLRVIPEIFRFEDQGKEGGLKKLAFSPNPAYKPKNYEETVLHAMSGVVLIDISEKRFAHFSATLTQRATFGYGLVGHLNQGGTIEVNRVRLSPGVWVTTLFRTDFDGRVAVFKSISKQLDETRTDFEPLPPDTNIQRALERIVPKSETPVPNRHEELASDQ